MNLSAVLFSTEKLSVSFCLFHSYCSGSRKKKKKKKKKKVLIELQRRVVHLNSSTAVSLREKRQNQTSEGQSSVLAGQDLPDNEVAALGFSQEGLQIHGGVLALLRLAVLIT